MIKRIAVLLLLAALCLAARAQDRPLVAEERRQLNGDVIVAFRRGGEGKVTGLVIEWKDGRKEEVPRD